jgi:hypothetical protein
MRVSFHQLLGSTLNTLHLLSATLIHLQSRAALQMENLRFGTTEGQLRRPVQLPN